ncbi:MAG: hydroxyacid dehydrogenase [Phycisphaerae bacterium]|nr:hydroxyacid dehydrogenase [Phycisphaerae bacterium]
MKILMADKFQEQYLDDLKALGLDYDLLPDLTADDLPGKIAGYDALIVRSTKVTAATIEASDKLKIIIRAGAGYNTIDVAKATEAGIHVCNTPGKNAVAVAELAFGLMMAIDRRIPDNVIELRAGKWNKKTYSKADGLFGKNVLVMGLGEIGFNFGTRACAFGMNVNGYDVMHSPELQSKLDAAGITFVKDLDEALKNADVISLHIPAIPATKGMINADFLSKVKNNTIILNTSRGEIVNDEDLLAAIESKKLRVGLDVYNNEPGTAQADFSNALTQHPSVYGTHHIGASTTQAQNAIAAEVVEIFRNFTQGKVLHAVNKA